MSIEEILEAMDDELDRSKNIPLTGGRSLIDVEQFRELVKQVRLNLPGEIKQAQALVNDRRVIINDAKAEAESIIRKAEEKQRSWFPKRLLQNRLSRERMKFSLRHRPSQRRSETPQTTMLKICSAELTNFLPVI